MAGMSWKERFISESSGVKHATSAAVEQLKNKPGLQGHLYAVPTATDWDPAGPLPPHHILHKGNWTFLYMILKV